MPVAANCFYESRACSLAYDGLYTESPPMEYTQYTEKGQEEEMAVMEITFGTGLFASHSHVARLADAASVHRVTLAVSCGRERHDYSTGYLRKALSRRFPSFFLSYRNRCLCVSVEKSVLVRAFAYRGRIADKAACNVCRSNLMREQWRLG